MSAHTWAELGQLKLFYACNADLHGWTYCRAIADHLRWEAELEQWLIAGFVGTAFLLLGVAVQILRPGTIRPVSLAAGRCELPELVDRASPVVATA